MDFTGHPEMGLERNDESVSKALAHIEQLTRDRLLKPVVDRVFEFDQVVEAHRYMETCPKRGRVVIHVADRGRPAAKEPGHRAGLFRGGQRSLGSGRQRVRRAKGQFDSS